ncbi:MAG: mechanosensitive ion channel family protein [Hyphomicrobiales bacterium]
MHYRSRRAAYAENTRLKTFLFLAFCVLSSFATVWFVANAQAQSAIEKSGLPVHITDHKMDKGEFALRLSSLTKAQMADFVEKYMIIVQDQTRLAADLNIALNSSDEGPAADRLRVDLEDALFKRENYFDKLTIAIDEWLAKGAKPEDVADYQKYATAVRTGQFKATDSRTIILWFTDWITSPEGGIGVAIWILTLFAAIFLVILISKMLSSFVRRALRRVSRVSQLLRDFISKFAYWLFIAIGTLITLSLFGIDMTPLLAIFGGASFIIGFAMQSTLSNLASGLLLMITKPFDVGDFVEAAGIDGKVEKVSIVSTTIKTLDNQVNVVPNTKVWDSVITNVNASDTRRVNMTFGIAYDDDIELARKTMLDLLKVHPLVLDEPVPIVRVSELGDSSVNLICWPWVKTDDYWEVLWDVQQLVKERFDEVGLSIPFPQRDVHLYKVDDAAITKAEA